MDDVRGFYPDVIDDFAGILIHLDGVLFSDSDRFSEWNRMDIYEHLDSPNFWVQKNIASKLV